MNKFVKVEIYLFCIIDVLFLLLNIKDWNGCVVLKWWLFFVFFVFICDLFKK